MSATAVDQVSRLLALVPYLQRNPGARVDEVAALFRITPEQLHADLWVVYFCGLPGQGFGDLIEIDMDAVEGHGVIHLSNADYLTRPLRLSPDEVLPLLLGLQTLREVADAEVAATIDTALAKLQPLAGESAAAAERVNVRVLSADERVRDQVSRALTDGVRLRLTHDSVSRNRSLTRVVDPYRLRVDDGYAYLDAWSEPPLEEPGAAEGWRSFRLDRVTDAEVIDEPVRPHAGEPDGADWLTRLGTAPEVTLELTRAAAWVAEYHPVEEVQPRRGGGVTVRLKVADPAWLRELLLRLGPEVRVVEPLSAAEGARSAAAEALARYAALYED
ncbi:WYL domain-containing protein [Enemella dayhoffiae]|uniref:WYL domain-containing protein n=1 Tax=Enemella dayhoffiae TaxID=2016507 RepID=A0A255H631_9ACTN|nr:WYL domain-containing protein [Enemella dayhoffiae]OYO22094.1 WYL domain-containing protein [Enemella dayhoffiae]